MDKNKNYNPKVVNLRNPQFSPKPRFFLFGSFFFLCVWRVNQRKKNEQSRCWNKGNILRFNKKKPVLLSDKILKSLQKKTAKQSAFSLVEMLMALLVASLLMAALAPVMTKKFNENVIVSGTGNVVIPEGGCVLTEGIEEEGCTIPNNTHSISVILASGGGGGGGAAKMSLGTTKYTDIINGSTLDSETSKTISLSPNMMDVSVQLTGGGGGGGVGFSNGKGYPAGQSDCGSWGVFVGPEYEGASGTGAATLPNAAGQHPSPSAGYHSVCVSRYNPATSANGGSATGAAPLINPGNTATCQASDWTGCKAENCPWGGGCCLEGDTGTSATDCATAVNGNSYGGCRRSVCMHNAAQTICSLWQPVGVNAGRLPRGTELRGWEPGVRYNHTLASKTGILNQYNSGYGGSSYSGAPSNVTYPGLQLCSWVGGNGSVSCGVLWYYCDSNGCLGHFPSNLWSAELSTVASLYSTNLSFGSTNDGKEQFYSTRCVIDRISTFSTTVGGGGSGGLYAEMKIPNEVLRKAFKESNDVKLTYAAGGGGTGGRIRMNSTDSIYAKVLSQSDDDKARFINGKDGKRSYATVTIGSNEVWKFSAPGGKKGGNSGTSGCGGGAHPAYTNNSGETDGCYYKNIYSTNASYKAGGYFACNSISDDGIVPTLAQGAVGVCGGNGGNSSFAGTTKTGGNINSSGTLGGAGGGGANCTEGPTRAFAKCNNAGNGGGGMARVSYKLAKPGVGGGGGGAGAVVHITNITAGIRPGVKITMAAGIGGNGGAAGNTGSNGANGIKGGDSYIEYSTNGINKYKFEAIGGYGGGGGIAGKPDDTTNGTIAIDGLGNIARGIDSIPGTGGKAGSIDTNAIRKLVGNNYITFPEDLSKTEGKSVRANEDYTVTFYSAPGGNGGINNKISPVDSIPCGGFSTLPIDFYDAKTGVDEEALKCNLSDKDDGLNQYIPLTLTETIIPRAFTSNFAKIMSKTNIDTYAGTTLPGSTGGGGGAWIWKENTDEQAAQGAKGMPGFVIIYWNLKEEESK